MPVNGVAETEAETEPGPLAVSGSGAADRYRFTLRNDDFVTAPPLTLQLTDLYARGANDLFTKHKSRGKLDVGEP